MVKVWLTCLSLGHYGCQRCWFSAVCACGKMVTFGDMKLKSGKHLARSPTTSHGDLKGNMQVQQMEVQQAREGMTHAMVRPCPGTVLSEVREEGKEWSDDSRTYLSASFVGRHCRSGSTGAGERGGGAKLGDDGASTS